jgi:hypothetical protein
LQEVVRITMDALKFVASQNQGALSEHMVTFADKRERELCPLPNYVRMELEATRFHDIIKPFQD